MTDEDGTAGQADPQSSEPNRRTEREGRQDAGTLTVRPRPHPRAACSHLHDEAPHMTRMLLTLLALAAFGARRDRRRRARHRARRVPRELSLKGTDDAPQLVVTGKRADGREVDLTGAATYTVSDPKVARVDQTGRVFPLANGTAEITATFGGKTVKVPLVAKTMDDTAAAQLRQPGRADLHQARLQLGRLPREARGAERLPPVAARLRAGPRLHDAREGRPRPAAVPGRPGREPFLMKATGASPHGGGKKMEPDSRRVQARPPVDRLRHAVRQREGPDRHEDQRVPRAPRH